MISISFTIPGRIGGKQRAGRQQLPGGKVLSFNPKQTVSQEAVVRQMAALSMRGHRLFEGPVGVHLTVVRVQPASWSKAKCRDTYWVTGKPDVDNMQKLIYDAINGIVWKDDAQIANVTFARYYGESESVEVVVTAL